MTQHKDQVRAEFENWMRVEFPDYSLEFEHGWYRQSQVQKMWRTWQARASAPQGVAATATKEMMRAAVIYANGADVYDKVPLAALEIEESIYGEAYAAMIAAAPRPVACGCEACKPNSMRMIVCEKCGNKRCPHATNHLNACTNSNEPGQKGSSYERAGLGTAAQQKQYPHS